jgi:hypothetical protein
MKIKPFLILAASAIILAACCILFIRSKNLSSSKSDEIVQYLTSFKKSFSNESGTQPLLDFFKDGRETKGVYETLEVLTGAPQEDRALQEGGFKVDFNADKATVRFINAALSVATVPVTFSKDGLAKKYSQVYFTVQKTGLHQYKILKLDGRDFIIAHQNYSNYVEENRYPDKEVYTPATLSAFKDVAGLRAKYDSVIWFSHLNGKNWFYVINGKWDFYNAFREDKDTAKTYKMGLVNPQFKEIIPVGFDVVHNIGGTVPNLVEVEKDHKRGLYDLSGKVIAPVEYDQIMAVKNGRYLAALKKDDHFYWLRKDYTISDKADLRITDLLTQLKQAPPFTVTKNPGNDVTEFNSRRMHGSIYIPPSYLVDLGLIPTIKVFENPLRRNVFAFGASRSYRVERDGKAAAKVNGGGNWLLSLFYTIKNHYIDGRSGLYTAKNLVIIDKKRNKAYGSSVINAVSDNEGEPGSSADCMKYKVKALNDSLFEVMMPSRVLVKLLNGTTLYQMPFYHYLGLKKSRLFEQNTGRQFGFTKIRKMADSDLNGCYVYLVKADKDNWKNEQGSINQYVLQYMKNEIYASYNYDFKDATWAEIFGETLPDYKAKNTNVDDSLTAIDKYNINFINSKLNTKKPNSLAAK